MTLSLLADYDSELTLRAKELPMTAMFNEEMKLEEERRVSDMRRSVRAVPLPVAGAFRPATPRRDNGGMAPSGSKPTSNS